LPTDGNQVFNTISNFVFNELITIFWQGYLRLWRRFSLLFRAHLLLSMTILSVVIGLLMGFALRGMNLSHESIRLINFPGSFWNDFINE
jgi:hypothetical protein